MIYVPCKTCKLRRFCSSVGDTHRRALSAHCNGLPSVDCQFYEEATWRGVDGVLDISPRPSEGDLAQNVHHGGWDD